MLLKAARAANIVAGLSSCPERAYVMNETKDEAGQSVHSTSPFFHLSAGSEINSRTAERIGTKAIVEAGESVRS